MDVFLKDVAGMSQDEDSYPKPLGLEHSGRVGGDAAGGACLVHQTPAAPGLALRNFLFIPRMGAKISTGTPLGLQWAQTVKNLKPLSHDKPGFSPCL